MSNKYTLTICDMLGEAKNGYTIYLASYDGKLTRIVFSKKDYVHNECIEVTRRELLADTPIFRKE